jgi:hypothetical protein
MEVLKRSLQGGGGAGGRAAGRDRAAAGKGSGSRGAGGQAGGSRAAGTKATRRRAAKSGARTSGNSRGKPSAADLARQSKDELYEQAKKLDIPGRSGMTKDELISAIRRGG